jgi:redox-sensitive bicupin YhaK (pirin superfamily)
VYFDVELPPGASFSHPLPPGHSAFVYPFEGSLAVGGRELGTHSAGVLGPGERVELNAGARGARFLLLAGRPLGEPVVQYGPFVMNTREEIEQAIRDYQSGELTRAA